MKTELSALEQIGILKKVKEYEKGTVTSEDFHEISYLLSEGLLRIRAVQTQSTNSVKKSYELTEEYPLTRKGRLFISLEDDINLLISLDAGEVYNSKRVVELRREGYIRDYVVDTVEDGCKARTIGGTLTLKANQLITLGLE